jgi:putative multiple sugar transport system permease protein
MKKINPIQKYFLTMGSMLRTNIRDYGMYIALGVIFIVFSIMTGGNFLKPNNFTNLLNQTAYVSVLAVGMTLVIVTRQIDLSVGYLGAFLGAYVVVSVEVNGQSIITAVIAALIITIFVGFVKGFLVAKIKIPAFVVTLAGMFIFKGFLMLKTNNRTIPTSNTFFNKIGVGYLTENTVGTVDTLTAIVGAILIILLIVFGIYKRFKNKRLGIPLEKIELFVTKTIIMSGLIFFIAYTLSRFRGISFLLLITAIIVVIYHIFTTQTVLGRRIYAVGGNPEAAELSGISVEKILIIVFISMGILALFSGVMYASMLQNTSPNHGPFWELYAIAAAYIGGTSANGGVGKVVNAFIGSVVIMSLKNGMALAAVNSNIEPIVLGSVLLLAVIFDVYTRNVRGADMIGMHYAKREYRKEFRAAKENLLKAKHALNAAKAKEKKEVIETYKVKFDQLKKQQTERNKLANKKSLRDLRQEFKREKEANSPEIIELEYRYTSALGEYNRIKDTIRSATEDDYILTKKVTN